MKKMLGLDTGNSTSRLLKESRCPWSGNSQRVLNTCRSDLTDASRSACLKVPSTFGLRKSKTSMLLSHNHLTFGLQKIHCKRFFIMLTRQRRLYTHRRDRLQSRTRRPSRDCAWRRDAACSSKIQRQGQRRHSEGKDCQTVCWSKSSFMRELFLSLPSEN